MYKAIFKIDIDTHEFEADNAMELYEKIIDENNFYSMKKPKQENYFNNYEGKTENSSNMKTYHIEGMNCNHCRMSAEKAIQAVPGVTSASVDLQKKEAYVEGTASPEAVCKAVEEVGFTCTF